MRRPLVYLPIMGLLLAAWPGAAPSRADAPVAAAAAVRRLLDAARANDRAAYLAELADDYDYAGQKKAGFDPFGFAWVLSDHFLYRLEGFSATGPGTAAALVETDFTGRLNLDLAGLGQPPVIGTSRLWIEVRQQRDGQWRVSAIRPVRSQYWHRDTPHTFVQGLRVNGRTSARVAPGATLRVEGDALFSIGVQVGIGATSKNVSLDLASNARGFQHWSAELAAPTQPGRYYVAATSLILVPRPDGDGLYLSADEMSVPVVVQ